MPRNITAKKVAMSNEKVVVIHDCTQVAAINNLLKTTNTLSILLTGNGDPDKGVCRKVALIALKQDNILTELSELHGSLKEYHEEAKEAKEKAIEVERTIDKFMSESAGVKKGKDEVSTAGQVKLNNIISIVGTILVVIGLAITVYFGQKGDEKLNTKIDNFGTPVILNSRGEIDKLPAGDSLKFFRDGKFKSTYKDTAK
jgi:hypothetical protein